jgi:hypothetical protein
MGKEIDRIRISPNERFAGATTYADSAIFMDIDHGRTTKQHDVFDFSFCPEDADCIFVAGSKDTRRLEISRLFAP